MAVSLAVAFPAGLFWSALYPQSLYFALSVASMALMLDGRVAPACLVASAATATRLEGIALLPALLAILIVRGEGTGSDRPPGALAPGRAARLAPVHGLSVSGLGRPPPVPQGPCDLRAAATNPIATLIRPLSIRDGIYEDGVFTTYFAGILLVLGTLARLRWPILLYGWLMFLIPLSTGVYISIYRVHLVNAPSIWPSAWPCGSVASGRLRDRARLPSVYETSMMLGWVRGSFHP